MCIIKEYRKLHLKYPVQVADAFKDDDEVTEINIFLTKNNLSVADLDVVFLGVNADVGGAEYDLNEM